MFSNFFICLNIIFRNFLQKFYFPLFLGFSNNSSLKKENDLQFFEYNLDDASNSKTKSSLYANDGFVLSIGDGIATVFGLYDVQAGELVEFSNATDTKVIKGLAEQRN